VSDAEHLPLLRVYDLRNPDAWRATHRHRGFWGKLHTDVRALGAHHAVLNFRSAPDERWRPWERARLRWILEERGAA
jgi:hypothetical protein